MSPTPCGFSHCLKDTAVALVMFVASIRCRKSKGSLRSPAYATQNQHTSGPSLILPATAKPILENALHHMPLKIPPGWNCKHSGIAALGLKGCKLEDPGRSLGYEISVDGPEALGQFIAEKCLQ